MATKEMEQFPRPGHIRNCSAGAPILSVETLGPSLDWEPSEHRDYVRRWMRDQQKPRELPENVGQGQRVRIPHTSKSIDEQKEEMRKKGYIQ